MEQHTQQAAPGLCLRVSKTWESGGKRLGHTSRVQAMHTVPGEGRPTEGHMPAATEGSPGSPRTSGTGYGQQTEHASFLTHKADAAWPHCPMGPSCPPPAAAPPGSSQGGSGAGLPHVGERLSLEPMHPRTPGVALRGAGGTENRPSVLYSALITRTHHRRPLLRYPSDEMQGPRRRCDAVTSGGRPAGRSGSTGERTPRPAPPGGRAPRPRGCDRAPRPAPPAPTGSI